MLGDCGRLTSSLESFFKFFIFGCVESLLLHALFPGCGVLALLSRCGVQASLQWLLLLENMCSSWPDFSSWGF